MSLRILMVRREFCGLNFNRKIEKRLIRKKEQDTYGKKSKILALFPKLILQLRLPESDTVVLIP